MAINTSYFPWRRLRDTIFRMVRVRGEIYINELGDTAIGVGHRITPDDTRYYGLPIGTPIDEEGEHSMQILFETDLRKAVDDCYSLYEAFADWHEEVQYVLAVMMYRLGLEKMAEYTDFADAIAAHDHDTAADLMMEMDWYSQDRRMATIVEPFRNAPCPHDYT